MPSAIKHTFQCEAGRAGNSQRGLPGAPQRAQSWISLLLWALWGESLGSRSGKKRFPSQMTLRHLAALISHPSNPEAKLASFLAGSFLRKPDCGTTIDQAVNTATLTAQSSFIALGVTARGARYIVIVEDHVTNHSDLLFSGLVCSCS